MTTQCADFLFVIFIFYFLGGLFIAVRRMKLVTYIRKMVRPVGGLGLGSGGGGSSGMRGKILISPSLKRS